MTSLNIMPGQLDLALYGGDDAPIVVNLTNAAGEPATVDGTLKATVYNPYGTPTSYALTTIAGAVGVYTINFDATTTRALAGLGVLSWDFQLHSTTGKTRTILKGSVTVAVEVTND
jgi:hypothetical protein